MSGWFVLGCSLVACGALRLMDCRWPADPLPWPVYAVEIGVGYWLMFSYLPNAGVQ